MITYTFFVRSDIFIVLEAIKATRENMITNIIGKITKKKISSTKLDNSSQLLNTSSYFEGARSLSIIEYTNLSDSVWIIPTVTGKIDPRDIRIRVNKMLVRIQFLISA